MVASLLNDSICRLVPYIYVTNWLEALYDPSMLRVYGNDAGPLGPVAVVGVLSTGEPKDLCPLIFDLLNPSELVGRVFHAVCSA